MLKEKLLSQMEVLENLQESCTVVDVDEALKLNSRILKLAQRIDNLDKTQTTKEIKFIAKVDNKQCFEKVFIYYNIGLGA